MRKAVFPLPKQMHGWKKPQNEKETPKESGFADCGRADQGGEDARPTASPSAKRGLLTFREIYRSRDGRMRLFADERTGHLAAVDSSRLV